MGFVPTHFRVTLNSFASPIHGKAEAEAPALVAIVAEATASKEQNLITSLR